MNNLAKFIHISCLFTFLSLQQSCTQPEPGFYSADDFIAVKKYDTHVHLNTSDTAYIKQAEEDNMGMLVIVDDRPFGITMEDQQKIVIRQLKAFPEQVAYATTFSVDNWEEENWAEQTIASLKDQISKGAIAVKIWKNIGMSLKDKDGAFVMVDHPRFDPVLDYLAKNNIPVIGHLGEPKNCWLPIEEMTVRGDRNYYREHPEYHMYLHPEFPSYEDQISARDQMLEKHPDLQFIGAHLGSLEWNLDELAKRLDRFPNMAVDLARMSHLRLHAKLNWQKTRDFFIKYQDRLLYATDPQVEETSDPLALKKRVHDSRIRNWKFFTTDEIMSDADIEGEFRGLKLPRAVIDKIYCKNAESWFPGIGKARPVTSKTLKVKKSPDFKITGEGSAKNWEAAEWVNIPQRSSPSVPLTTKVKLLYSQTGIYFLFYCQDKKLTSTMDADFMDLWKEDVVEVFLWPDEAFPVYFEYEISPLNYELPILISNKEGDLVRWQPFHYDEDRQTLHATAVKGGEKKSEAAVTSWTAEFFIPYKLLRPLTNISPGPGTRWRANMYRVDYDAGETGWSWQPTAESYHEYKKFGTLLFE